jgi:acetylornithine/N-succinyldiaminopimelate aminotransferase
MAATHPASVDRSAPSPQAPSPPRDGGGAEGAASREASLLATAGRRLLGNYRQAPFVLARGEGCRVWDTEDREYLDLTAGVAVTALGHAHPALVATIAAQAGRLMHASNYFYNEENVLLAEELCAATGFDRAFFCNSGAEANEAMIKLARRHFWARGEKDRYRIIAFDASFHGRTIATIALTGTPAYREGFGPPVAGVTHVPYGDEAAVRAAMGPDVCAILVEPVQGEGGVTAAPPGFLRALRQICDEHGALLLLDEIQTGMGRTGTLLGCEHQGVVGDAASLAKGLAGGFPIGAMLLTERLAGALPPGTHGSTFGGNALASAAARTVLATVRAEGLVEAARTKGEHLGRKLAELAARYPALCEGERGLGLLRGLVLRKDAVDPRKALAKAREHRVLLTIAGGRVLRFTPPLVVTEAELDEGVRRLDAALGELVAGEPTAGERRAG